MKAALFAVGMMPLLGVLWLLKAHVPKYLAGVWAVSLRL
jgi:hypothetical protein